MQTARRTGFTPQFACLFLYFGQHLKLFIRSNSGTAGTDSGTDGERNSWHSGHCRICRVSWGVSNVLVRFALFFLLSFFLSIIVLLLLLFLSPTQFAFCLVEVVVVFQFEARSSTQASLGFASQTSQAGPGERVFEARHDATLKRRRGAWRQQFTFKRMQKYA